MKISALIPCYNAEHTIRQCVESVISQEGAFAPEIVIVENGSMDNSWRTIERLREQYPDQIVTAQITQPNANIARNQAFDLSTGDYIQWLDADDELIPGKWSAQYTQLKVTDADIAYSNFICRTLDGSGTSSDITIEHTVYDDFIYALLRDKWSHPANYLIGRSLGQTLHEKGAWNPETVVCQDREYFTLAALYSRRSAYVPGTFSIYNQFPQKSVSRSSCQIARQHQLIKLFDRFDREILQHCAHDFLDKYRARIDTSRLTSSVWIDQIPYSGSTSLYKLRWSEDSGLKLKVLMLLKHFGIETALLATRLLTPKCSA